MNKTSTITILIILCGSFLATKFADTNLLIVLRSSLNEYSKDNPQEKLYLHLSQPYYVTGDHLWYKAYQVDAKTNIPTSLSGSVYVELASLNGLAIQKQILKMKDGFGSSDFIIPDSITTGIYKLSAWTNWMKNFNLSGSFIQDITIVNPNDNNSVFKKSIPDNDSEFDLQFFPEGGSLIDNFSTRIALDSDDIAFKGEVINSQGQLITKIESSNGLGSFSILPQFGDSYSAKVYNSGKEYTFKLPIVSKEGVNLVVNNIPDKAEVDVTIRATKNYLKQRYLLLIQSQGQIVFNSDGVFDEQIALKVPKNNLKHGINQLVIFDSFGSEIGQRIFFIRKNDELQWSVTPDKKSYSPREKVNLKIRNQNITNKRSFANLSVVVRDKRQLKSSDYTADIATQFLLRSELNNNLEIPTSYLSNQDGSVKALDLWLITKKWDRFDWEKITNKTPPLKNYSLEQGFSFHSKIRIPSGLENTLDRSSITLSRVGVAPYFRDQFLYDGAQFTFRELDFLGTGSFDIQVIAKHEITEQIQLAQNNNLLREKEAESGSLVALTEEMRNYVRKEQLRRRVLNDFQIKTKLNNEESTISKSLNHFQVDDVKILKDFLPFADMKDIIREILPNVKFQKNKRTGESELVVYDRVNFTHKRKPTFLIDGILEFDPDVFLDLNVDDVASIEVVRSKENTAVFGPYGWGGLIIVHTYDNNYRSNHGPNFTTVEIEGFHKPQKFTSWSDKEFEEGVPNLGALTYWNPEIITDQNGEASVSFYTSDEIGEFEIRLEGISDTGIPIVTSSSYTVSLGTQ